MTPTQSELHAQCLDRLHGADARSAFDYLLHHGSTLSGYQCHLVRHGFKLAYNYMRDGGNPFAFIVNRNSLLFYFRRPGLDNAAANFKNLSTHFQDVELKKDGVITLRLQNKADAIRLSELIFGLPSA